MRDRQFGSETSPSHAFSSYKHFEHSGLLPTGWFSIDYAGYPVDFFYDPSENAQTTIVFFHGSTTQDVKLPVFTGSGITKGLEVNRLSISDPSIALDENRELILSWYIGSAKQPNLQFFIETVIRRILQISGTPHLIFMGGSGGGFAALEMSRRFGKSLAFAMNPQIDLSNYYPRLVSEYLRLSWDGMSSLSDLPDGVTYNLRATYNQAVTNTIAYRQNTRDSHHTTNHQIPFLEDHGHSLRLFMQMAAWGDPKGKGHVQAPPELTRKTLDILVASRGKWRTALKEAEFTHRTSVAVANRLIREANQNLPVQEETDEM